MNRRWVQLLERDTGARWNILISSMVFTALAGFFSELGGISVSSAEIIAILVGGTALFVQGSLYSSGPRRKQLPKTKFFLRNLYVSLMTISITAAAALLISIFAPVVQGSVLNKRLQRVLTIDQPSKRTTETRGILKLAAQSKVQLNSNLVSLAIEQTQQGKSEDDWRTFLTALNYKYASRSDTNQSHSNGYVDLDTVGEWVGGGFDGLRIVYHGRPTSLSNVHFENTTFEIDDTENGRKLAKALAASKDGTISIALD